MPSQQLAVIEAVTGTFTARKPLMKPKPDTVDVKNLIHMTSPGEALALRVKQEMAYLRRTRTMLRKTDLAGQDWESVGLTLAQARAAKTGRSKAQIDEAMAKLESRVRSKATADFNQDRLRNAPVGWQKVWVARHDSRTRDSHMHLNGQVVAKRKKFRVGRDGIMYPGDPQSKPELHINCRCVLIFLPPRIPTLAASGALMEDSFVVESCDDSVDYYATPANRQAAQQAKERVRVPKGQPDGGQFKDTPNGAVKDLFLVLSRIKAANGTGRLPSGIKDETAKTKRKRTSRKAPATGQPSGGAGMVKSGSSAGGKKKSTKRQMHLATKQEIAALEKKYHVTIPKNWTKVYVNPNGKGLIASGRDAGGKRQRIYTKEYTRAKEARRLKRAKKAAERAAKLKAIMAKESGKSPAYAMVKAIYTSGVHPKNVMATTHGDVSISNGQAVVRMKTRKGKVQQFRITDPQLVNYISSRLHKNPKGHLFAGDNTEAVDLNEPLFPVTMDEVNAAIKTATGEDLTADDVQRLYLDKLVHKIVTENLGHETMTEQEFEAVRTQAANTVAGQLGEDPDVAQAAYITQALYAPLQERVKG